MKTKNHMEFQKSAPFVKKNLNKKMLNMKNIVKLGTIVVIHGNIDVQHIAYVI